MDESKKERKARKFLTYLVENNGNILINSKNVRRVFSDEDFIAKIELRDRSVVMVEDADLPTMEEAIKEYLSYNDMPEDLEDYDDEELESQ